MVILRPEKPQTADVGNVRMAERSNGRTKTGSAYVNITAAITPIIMRGTGSRLWKRPATIMSATGQMFFIGSVSGIGANNLTRKVPPNAA